MACKQRNVPKTQVVQGLAALLDEGRLRPGKSRKRSKGGAKPSPVDGFAQERRIERQDEVHMILTRGFMSTRVCSEQWWNSSELTSRRSLPQGDVRQSRWPTQGPGPRDPRADRRRRAARRVHAAPIPGRGRRCVASASNGGGHLARRPGLRQADPGGRDSGTPAFGISSIRTAGSLSLLSGSDRQ